MNDQTGFSEFINETEMVSFSSFVRTLTWFLVIVSLDVVGCILLLTARESWGIQVTAAVLGALGVTTAVGAVNLNTVRKTAKEYAPVAAAKARAKAGGAAVVADKVEKVEVAGPGNGVVIGQASAGRDEREPSVFHDDERGE